MKKREYIEPELLVIGGEVDDCLLSVSDDVVKSVETSEGSEAEVNWGGGADDKILDR